MLAAVGTQTMMLYAALAFVVVAVLSTMATLWGPLGVPVHVGHNASIAALVLAAVALLLFAMGSARKTKPPRERR